MPNRLCRPLVRTSEEWIYIPTGVELISGIGKIQPVTYETGLAIAGVGCWFAILPLPQEIQSGSRFKNESGLSA